MFPKTIGMLLCLIYSTQLFAKIEFVSPPDAEWERETLATMAWVNDQLPRAWTKPNNFKIALVKKGEPRYYPVFHYKDKNGQSQNVHNLLVVGDQQKEKTIHEYGHLIFDIYFREHSPAWQYYLVWQEIGFRNMDEEIVSYQKLTERLKTALEDFLQKKDQGDSSPLLEKAIFNSTNSIKKYEQLVDELMAAKALQNSSPFPLDQINAFIALQGMNELFADTLAALLLENWSVMKNVTLYDIENTDLGDQLILPPAESKQQAIELYLAHRDFQENLDVETYQYEDWELKSPYTRYAPIRSLLRSLKNNGASNEVLLSATLAAIKNVFDTQLVPFPENMERSLLERNRALRDSLLKELELLN